jgi:hypothetical protein
MTTAAGPKNLMTDSESHLLGRLGVDGFEGEGHSLSLRFSYDCCMTVPEKIAAFLKARKPAAFCDDCLASNLNLAGRQLAQQATGPLSQTLAYVRMMARCSQCGATIKLVIRSIER